jgi:tetraacyldisaccharide 4'-kinase
LTPFYRLAIGVRNRRFDRAMANSNPAVVHRVNVPVVSVGNLTTGGTGKTPLVIWIAHYLQNQNVHVTLVSRGYGSAPTAGEAGRNDEAMEIEKRLPDVPHLQSPDRFSMAQRAIAEFDTQCIVLDDGFQHRHLHRDLDIVLIDATLPFGFDRLLPRGLLREPLSALRRADLVILTRTDLVASEQRETTISRIRKHTGERPVLETRTLPAGLIQSNGEQVPVERISSQPIFFFCGIGNPDNFEVSLHQQGFAIRGSAIFADHHHFSPEEIDRIAKSAQACGAEAIICTHKDLVKIGRQELGRLPLYAIIINVEFLNGQATIESKLNLLVERSPSRQT